MPGQETAFGSIRGLVKHQERCALGGQVQRHPYTLRRLSPGHFPRQVEDLHLACLIHCPESGLVRRLAVIAPASGNRRGWPVVAGFPAVPPPVNAPPSGCDAGRCDSSGRTVPSVAAHRPGLTNGLSPRQSGRNPGETVLRCRCFRDGNRGKKTGWTPTGKARRTTCPKTAGWV